MSGEVKNLEAIAKAINQHNVNCEWPATCVAMNHFERERLGWTDIRGLPIIVDAAIASGRFEVRCDRPVGGPPEAETTEAVAEPVTVGAEAASQRVATFPDPDLGSPGENGGARP